MLVVRLFFLAWAEAEMGRGLDGVEVAEDGPARLAEEED